MDILRHLHVTSIATRKNRSRITVRIFYRQNTGSALHSAIIPAQISRHTLVCQQLQWLFRPAAWATVPVLPPFISRLPRMARTKSRLYYPLVSMPSGWLVQVLESLLNLNDMSCRPMAQYSIGICGRFKGHRQCRRSGRYSQYLEESGELKCTTSIPTHRCQCWLPLPLASVL